MEAFICKYGGGDISQPRDFVIVLHLLLWGNYSEEGKHLGQRHQTGHKRPPQLCLVPVSALFIEVTSSVSRVPGRPWVITNLGCRALSRRILSFLVGIV